MNDVSFELSSVKTPTAKVEFSFSVNVVPLEGASELGSILECVRAFAIPLVPYPLWRQTVVGWMRVCVNQSDLKALVSWMIHFDAVPRPPQQKHQHAEASTDNIPRKKKSVRVGISCSIEVDDQ